MNHWLTTTVRWSARISGLALAGLTVLFCVGEGGPQDLLQRPLPVQFEFAGLLMMIIGFVVGWSRAALGGIVAVAGFVLFTATELLVNGSLPGGAGELRRSQHRLRGSRMAGSASG